jgi:hypothetical protein
MKHPSIASAGVNITEEEHHPSFCLASKLGGGSVTTSEKLLASSSEQSSVAGSESTLRPRGGWEFKVYARNQCYFLY